MQNHLADETLIDLLEETAGPEASRHRAECRLCETRLQEVQAGQRLASSAEVPEPSPLYWEHLRRQVGRRVEALEPRRSASLIWGPLLAAAAAVLIAVWAPGPRGGGPTLTPTLPAWSALPPAENDEGLAVLAAIVPNAGEAFGVVADCRDLGNCLAELSDEESEVLVEALRGQLARGGTS